MPILKIFRCDVCGKEHKTKSFEEGAPGWGQLNGICFNGVDNPMLCPEHKMQCADLMDLTRAQLGVIK